MRVAVAQLGPRQHYAEARVFLAAGCLERLFTDVYAGDKPALVRVLRAVPGAERVPDVRRFLACSAPGLPAEKVTSFDWLGLKARLALRRCRSDTDRYRVYDEVGRAFQAAVLRQGLGEADTLFVSTGAAGDLVAHAAVNGVRTVLQQFAPPATTLSKILAEERTRWPDAEAIPFEPLPNWLWERCVEEERRALVGADLVLAASAYTRRSLAAEAYDIGKVRIVPLSVDVGLWKARLGERPGNPTLHVLYAGQVGLGKGVLYLVEAVRRLRSRKIRLTLAGTVALRRDLLTPSGCDVEVLGPVPRGDVPKLMRAADLFVFPTLGEGFGLVQIEALACGTPVIATTECGEVVREGIEGHVVPPRDADAIARWLDHYAARPTSLHELREAAATRAQEFSLDNYARKLLETIAEGRYRSSTTRVAHTPPL